MHIRVRTIVGVAVLVLIGCVGSREAVRSLNGDWTYRVETDDAVYQGILSFETLGDRFEGTIQGEGTGGTVPLRDLEYDGSELTFSFESPEYGTLHARLEFDGDAYAGELDVTSYGMSLPMTGSRIDPR